MLKASAVILAGGKNSRMGKEKAFLKIGNNVIIEQIIKKMSNHFEQIIIVTNKPSEYMYLKTDVVADIIPGFGPLSGIHTGLKTSRFDYSLFMACDMPFISTDLGKLLFEEAKGYDGAVPKIDSYYQPLFAVYSKRCVKPIELCMSKSMLKVTSFYPQVRINFVGPELINTIDDVHNAFFNINTPKELEKAAAMNSF